MKRIALLCLFLTACQNQETNERLARVEKKLDQIQQNPPVEKITVPTPESPLSTAPPPAPPTSDYYLIDRKAAVAVANNPDGVGRFVPTSRDPEEGFVFHEMSGKTRLFRLHASTGQYVPVAVVPNIMGSDGKVHITDEMNASMRAALEKPE
jgi:hypothetical protein